MKIGPNDYPRKIKQTLTSKGLSYTISLALKRTHNHILNTITIQIPFYVYKKFRKNRTFIFENEKLRYFYHRYNLTWKNERTVEIPIVCHFLKSRKGKMLEVGNVLSHYFENNYDIVDKYEKGEGVINKDIIDVNLPTNYDTIISISTVEHVGWNENSKAKRLNDGEKIPLAMEVMKKKLLPGGMIIITVPLGFNPYLDELVRNKKLGFSQEFFLKRISSDTWVETNWQEVKNSRYNSPYPAANAILVGLIKN